MIDRLARTLRLGLVAALLGPVAGGEAAAATLKIDGKTEVVATTPFCTNVKTGRRYKDCTSTATISKSALGGKGDTFFGQSFEAWNAAQADAWTLVTKDDDDNALSVDGEMVVTLFNAVAAPTFGGLQIRVQWREVSSDYKEDYFWSQAVHANYDLDGNIVAPYAFMDVKNKTSTCRDIPQAAPFYYCQYGTRKFYDYPKGPWPNASFRGHAYISKVDREARTLTIYDGIDYGFVLSATPIPLPATIPLMLGALVPFAALAARRRRAAPSR
ncbi:hypothetical protein SAMN05444722_1289 [Rhodovulum sp. ES.010]|uniref:hypothetical protein n=1 Tax=Rhodovulum sp. ES.010 TaxID=1882821 RepID=UPI0009295B18|nr:hypothetical protein [Rhodovulum sp. ES.010]SIO29873.1 hypothetical protein SAMN05444722_1289 [Rhodovulum sp. ES.010]